MSTVTPSNDFVQIRPEVQSSRVLSQPQATEFELKALEKQRKTLKYFSDSTNTEIDEQKEHEIFTNLSLVDLFRKMSSTIIDIINELLEINAQSSIDDIIYIFIQKDRLIYIGIIILLIAIGLYLMDITG